MPDQRDDQAMILCVRMHEVDLELAQEARGGMTKQIPEELLGIAALVAAEYVRVMDEAAKPSQLETVPSGERTEEHVARRMAQRIGLRFALGAMDDVLHGGGL